MVLPVYRKYYQLIPGFMKLHEKVAEKFFFHSTVTQCEKSLSEIFFSFAAAWAICFMNGKKATGKEKEVQV